MMYGDEMITRYVGEHLSRCATLIQFKVHHALAWTFAQRPNRRRCWSKADCTSYIMLQVLECLQSRRFGNLLCGVDFLPRHLLNLVLFAPTKV